MLRSGLLALAASALLAAPAAARPTVVASHLDRPRGLAFAPDGTLYATLVGHGGTPCNGEGCFGATGRGVRVTHGGVQTVAGGLLSMRGLPDGYFSIGADQLTLLADGRLATAMTAEFSGGDPAPPSAVPAGLRPQVGHLLYVTPGTGAVEVGPDIAAVEQSDPDGEGKVSNPFGVAVLGDTVYVSDSAGNDLIEVDPGAPPRAIATFPRVGGQDAVPDALTAGPDGALYVGEFTGGSQRRGTARIWRVVPGQAPAIFATGLTSITDLAFGPDGSLYATEFARGDVVRIAPDGSRTRLGGLHFPGGIAVAPGGAVYVSNWTVAGARPLARGKLKGRSGQIVRLTSGRPS